MASLGFAKTGVVTELNFPSVIVSSDDKCSYGGEDLSEGLIIGR